MALAFNVAVGRAGSVANDNLSLYLEKQHGVPFSLWIGFVFVCTSFIFGCIMLAIDRWANKKDKEGASEALLGADAMGRSDAEKELSESQRIDWRQILEFRLSFWLLCLSCVTIYGTILPWNNIGSDFLKHQYDLEDTTANLYLSIPFGVAAGVAPFLGGVIDRFGHRTYFLITASINLVITHFLFAYATHLNPAVPTALMGLAYSVYASTIWPSFAVVVRQQELGTAYGIATAMQNGGLAAFAAIVGYLQVHRYAEKKKGEEKADTLNTQGDYGYRYVSMFFAGLAIFGVLIALAIYVVDARDGGRLNKVQTRAELDIQDGKHASGEIEPETETAPANGL